MTITSASMYNKQPDTLIKEQLDKIMDEIFLKFNSQYYKDINIRYIVNEKEQQNIVNTTTHIFEIYPYYNKMFYLESNMIIYIVMMTTNNKTNQPKLNHNGIDILCQIHHLKHNNIHCEYKMRIGDECNYYEALEFLYTLRAEFK